MKEIDTMKRWIIETEIGTMRLYYKTYELAKEVLEYLPTEDVKEVVRDKNITENHPVDEFICSECGFMCEGYTEIIIDEHDLDKSYMECVFNFCPNCGVDLRGVEND